MTELIVIRHGETEWNLAGKLQGHLDAPLTELGKTQADLAAARLSRIKFDRIYSSDLGRAKATANAISNATAIPVVEKLNLRERALGVIQGLTWQEVSELYPEVDKGYRSNPDYVIPEGESLRQLYDRTVAAFESIAAEHPGERVVVVTHGGVVACLFRYIVGQPLSEPRKTKLPNAAINVIEKGSRGWLIHTWGDTSHLES